MAVHPRMARLACAGVAVAALAGCGAGVAPEVRNSSAGPALPAAAPPAVLSAAAGDLGRVAQRAAGGGWAAVIAENQIAPAGVTVQPQAPPAALVAGQPTQVAPGGGAPAAPVAPGAGVPVAPVVPVAGVGAPIGCGPQASVAKPPPACAPG